MGAVFAGEGRCVATRVWRAVGTWDRMRGLLGRPPLATSEGFLIEHCGMVHTFGMRYRLDLAFLDARGRVCKVVHGLRPARCAGTFKARSTLELAPGTLAATGLKLGDELNWREVA
ncbi:MAG: hypothetical protein JWN94_1304 [Betaproteobacteria bacterium]|nr:hypothetical protein [Betaproteobacteria bacterium]